MKKSFTCEPSFNVDEYDKDNTKEIEFHFFGSSCSYWRASTDFKEIYDFFSKQDQEFSIFFVPRHPRTGYEINYGSPQNVDAHWLGSYRPPNQDRSYYGRPRPKKIKENA